MLHLSKQRFMLTLYHLRQSIIKAQICFFVLYFVECGTPPTTSNGRFMELDGGLLAALLCTAGFQVTLDDGGSPGIRCLESGMWTNPTATCTKPGMY